MPQLSLVGYHLTFDDEFSNPALLQVSPNGPTQYNDSYIFGNWLYNNSEAEYYVDPAAGPVNPFSIRNGALTITAQPTIPGEQTSGQPYTSGLITTANSFSQNQGYFEIRCETPSTQGFWPAFWMLPQGGGGTPEIDVLEQPNLKGLSSYWSYARTGVNAPYGGGWIDTNANLSTTYNTYGVLWTPASISFYFNGVQVGTELPVPTDFVQQMYMLVNLAVGGVGSWPGTPGATTIAQLNVDYLRVYSNNAKNVAVAQQVISSPDGVDTTPSYLAAIPIVVPSASVGLDVLKLVVAEDYWLNNAAFTVTIDGIQQGGTLSTVASHAMGQTETFLFNGSFGTAAHTVGINFLNDAYGGSAQQDVNLYVVGAEINGTLVNGSTFEESSNGTHTINFTAPPAAAALAVSVNSAIGTVDTLTLLLGETPGLGNAQFSISIDGVQQGGVQTVSALSASQQTQAFTVHGNLKVGPHVLSLTLLNPASSGAGSAQAITLGSATLNGAALPLPGGPITWTTATPQTVAFTEPGIAPTIIGQGAQTLQLSMSEDFYLTDAQFTVSVDGVQQGGTQTVSASNRLGQSQAFNILGNFSNGTHIATVNFLNDAYGGSTLNDRNLFVLGAQINGVAVSGSTINEYGGGAQSFNFTSSGAVTLPTIAVTAASAALPDSLTLQMTQTAGTSTAKFTIAVNSVQQGGVQTTTASAAAGESQAFVVNGKFPSGANTVAITFLNSTGTASAQSLMLNSATLNGVAVPGPALTLTSSVAQSFSFTEPGLDLTTIGTGADTLMLSISEDAYLGNAQFTVSVDGVQQGGTLTASAINSLNQAQSVAVKGNYSPGLHTATVNFLNDLSGSSPDQDRNLYVLGAQLNGVAVPASKLTEYSGGPQSFAFTAAPTGAILPAITVTPASPATPDVLTLQVAELTAAVNAQFTISVDGVQQGGTLTAGALQSAGASQKFIVNGAFSGGTHNVAVNFLNPVAAGPASGLVVQSATVDGVAIANSTLTLTSAAPQSFSFLEPGLALTRVGSGPDTLLLNVSEDAYLGHAQFTVSIDGVKQGGTLTAQANNSLGQSQVFAIGGNFTPGAHAVTVDFLNDLYGGSSSADRNLFVLGAQIDGVSVAKSALNEYAPGPQSFAFTEPAVRPTPVVSPGADGTTTPDSITFALTETAYQGDAQVALSLDGNLLGAPSVTFLNSAGTSQLFTFTGNFGGNLIAHTASVDLLNALTGGSLASTRSVVVQSITFDGSVSPTLPMMPTTISTNGAVNFILGH